MSCGTNSHHRHAGRRFELVSMGADEPDPIPPGSQGTVHSAVDNPDGSIHLNVDWDPDVRRSLNLITPPDSVRWLDEAENA